MKFDIFYVWSGSRIKKIIFYIQGGYILEKKTYEEKCGVFFLNHMQLAVACCEFQTTGHVVLDPVTSICSIYYTHT